MNKKVRFGLIGCGAIAPWHIKAIETVESAELVAVMDTDSNVARTLGRQLGVPFYTVAEKLFSDEVDAVSICTPSGLHASLASKALQAGKHVVVEKPIAITEQSLEELLCAERASKAMLCPISQLRSMPDVQKAKQIVEDGLLGKIVMADLSMKYYRDPAYYEEKKWRGTWAMDGGGALMNQGIHGLDLMRYLCGEVSSVSAYAGTLYHAIETEDTLAASLRFSHGGFGVVTATTSVFPGFQRRLEICGTDGSLVMEEAKLIQLHTRDGVTVFNKSGDQQGGSNDPSKIDFKPHVLQYQDVVRAIQGESPLKLTSADAAQTVRLVLKLYRSAQKMLKDGIER